MVFKVGLTGNIGSGKTQAAIFFKALGVPIIDADEIAKTLVQPGTSAYNTVVKHFGLPVLLENKQLNRAWLKKTIFGNNEEKKWLEALLHPLIHQAMQKQASILHTPYCILSIPLLFESHFENEVDRILLITCDKATQLSRIKARDKLSNAFIEAILKTQMPQSEQIQKSDDIFDNSGPIEDLETQIEILHQQYLKLAIK